MCRLTAVICSEDGGILLADILTRPRMSIIRQSFYCQERRRCSDPRWAYEVSSLNGDGFGVGWYLPLWVKPRLSEAQKKRPCVFTSLKPAWSDRNLVNIAEHTISPLMFAHVRAAGPDTGWPSENNCHPFSYGRFLFMHNGTIGEWGRVRSRFLSLLSPEAFDYAISTGVIDSVAIFGLIISQLADNGTGNYSPNELRLILERTVAIIEEVCREECVKEPSFLNLLLTDGCCIFATRHVIPPYGISSDVIEPASLYFATGTKWGRDAESSDSYRMVHTDKRNDIAIITSEALTETDNEWVMVPRNHILIVTPGVDVLLYKVSKPRRVLMQMISDATKQQIKAISKSEPFPTRLLSVTALLSQRSSIKEIPLKRSWLPTLECITKTTVHNRGSLQGRDAQFANAASPYLHDVSPTVRNKQAEVLISSPLSPIPLSSDKRNDDEISTGKTSELNTEGHPSELTATEEISIERPDESEELKNLEKLQSITQSLDVLSTNYDMFYRRNPIRDAPIDLLEDPSSLQSLKHVWSHSAAEWDIEGRSGTGDSFSDGFICHSFLSAAGDDFSSQPSPPTYESQPVEVDSVGQRPSLSGPLLSNSPIQEKENGTRSLLPAVACRHWITAADSAILSVACFSVWPEKPGQDRVLIGSIYHFHHRAPYSYVITGCQDGLIHIWSVVDGVCLKTFRGIQGGALSLLLVYVEEASEYDSQPQLLLFAGSSDTTITIWDLSDFLKVSTPPSLEDHSPSRDLILTPNVSSPLLCISFDPQQGDVLSLALHSNCVTCPTIYAGFQTTVIGYFYLKDVFKCLRLNIQRPVDNLSYQRYSTTLHFASNLKVKGEWHQKCFSTFEGLTPKKALKENANQLGTPPELLSVECHVIRYGPLARHCGFVESLVSCGPFLCSGGGDGLILVWKNNCPVRTLIGHHGGVLCLVASELSLYSGSRDNTIRAWDLVTLSCRQTLKGHSSDVLCLALTNAYLISGAANGEVFCWERKTHQLLKRLLARGSRGYQNRIQTKTSAITSLCIVPHPTEFKNMSSVPAYPADKICIVSKSIGNPTLEHPTPDSIDTQSEAYSYSEYDNGPEYEIVATGGDGALRLWKLEQPCTTGVGSLPPRGVFRNLQQRSDLKVDITGDQWKSQQSSSDEQHQSGILISTDLSSDFEVLLRDFVGFQSISGRPAFLEESWRAARFLGSVLEAIGAAVKLIDVGTGYAPLVTGRLGCDKTKPTVLFYSHYDVVPITSCRSMLRQTAKQSQGELLSNQSGPNFLEDSVGQSRVSLDGHQMQQSSVVIDHPTSCRFPSSILRTPHWHSDPWQLTAINGYYYGRGVTDNKGPILAQVFSVLGLQQACRAQGIELPVNVVWLSEGDEESGSTGFEHAVQKLQETSDLLAGVSCVMCTNSYWVDDTKPCIVVGMRGVIDMTVSIEGGLEPYGHHSGVHGGAIVEPMLDLLGITSVLVDNNGKVLVPRFYDDVDSGLELDESLLKEKAICNPSTYRHQVNNAGLRDGEALDVLKKRWLEPVLSITEVWSSNQEGSVTELGQTFRVIPSRASCNISIRSVPKQNTDELIRQVEDYLQSTFRSRCSPNHLSISVTNAFDWWTGDVTSRPFRAALRAVQDVWGIRPLVVREGGTMPVIRFLQDQLRVPAINLPIGQASDGAHMPNERIRIVNLKKGMDALQQFFINLAAHTSPNLCILQPL